VPTIAYENGLECGNPRFACEIGTVVWEYPDTGVGVTFEYW
jgi:ferredoxin-like protein FixX